jgi:hypothetical protein
MTKDDIKRVCDNTKNLLVKKNEAYGDSALNPLGIFGNGDAVVSLGARMDDKLMRLKSLGIGKESIDTLYDLHGYITLLIIAIERKENLNSFDSVCDDDSNTTKLISDARENHNDVQERQRYDQPQTHYHTNLTGAYQEWQTEILDREGPWSTQRGPERESDS